MLLVSADAEQNSRRDGTSRYRYELFGESLRELGVLLLVFVPLETLIQTTYRWRVRISLSAFLIGFFLIWVGIWIEGRS
jgi:hypothetical protein